jgi:hypothetical protein
LEAIRPIVELAVQAAFVDRIRQAGISQAMAEAAGIGQACPEARVFSEPKINSGVKAPLD